MTLCRFSSLVQVLSCCDKQSVFVCGTEMLWSTVQLSLRERWGRSVISICTCGQTEYHLESQKALFGCSGEGKVQAASTCKESSTRGIFYNIKQGHLSAQRQQLCLWFITLLIFGKIETDFFCVCYGWEKKLQAHRNSCRHPVHSVCDQQILCRLKPRCHCANW